MSNLAAFDVPGTPLTHTATFVYYDQPLLYALYSPSLDLTYLVNAVDEDSDTFTQLLTPLTAQKYEAVRTGADTLASAYTEATTCFVAVSTFDEKAPAISEVAGNLIPARWLPTNDVRLRSHKDTP